MGAAGEPAVHLLSRLLQFEPKHRAAAAEALTHEYFYDVDAVSAGGRQPAKPGAGSFSIVQVLPINARTKAHPGVPVALAKALAHESLYDAASAGGRQPAKPGVHRQGARGRPAPPTLLTSS